MGGMSRIVELGGDSMGPGLPRGSRVLVVPFRGEPHPGDVVLLEVDRPVLHRVLLTFVEDGRLWVVHRGDGGGRMALAPADGVRGRAVFVLAEAGLRPLPTTEDLDVRDRRTLRRDVWLARLYLRGRRLARALGPWTRRLYGRASRRLWRLG